MTGHARDLTLRLVSRVAGASSEPGAKVLAAREACERTYRTLTRRLGLSGSDVLFSRALDEARSKHPALSAIRVGRESATGVDGVTSAVEIHGSAAVAAGLEAMLANLLGLLARLIGDDMVARLVDETDGTEPRAEDTK